MLAHTARRAARFTCLGVAILTAGCVLGVEPPAAGPPSERPAPRDETPGKPPPDCGPGCEWSPGYWHWDGSGYVWVSGHFQPRGVANSGS